MLEKMPNTNDITQLIGDPLYDVWEKLCAMVDEKWIMFEPVDTTMFNDFSHMLQIKRRPNRK